MSTDPRLVVIDLEPGAGVIDRALAETDLAQAEIDRVEGMLPALRLVVIDLEPGVTDLAPAETDRELGNDPAAVEPAIGQRKDKSMIFWM